MVCLSRLTTRCAGRVYHVCVYHVYHVCVFSRVASRSRNSDERLMPMRRAAWSAWNYLGKSTEIAAAASKGQAAETKPVFVTYWLNKVTTGGGGGGGWVSLEALV